MATRQQLEAQLLDVNTKIKLLDVIRAEMANVAGQDPEKIARNTNVGFPQIDAQLAAKQAQKADIEAQLAAL